MTFPEVALQCAGNDELVSNFDRMRGTNVSRKGAPLDIAIDQATGRFEHDMGLFLEFVYECVWLRMDRGI